MTLHSLLKLPVGSKRQSDLTGQSLIQLQEQLGVVDYLIIDEYSMLGQKMFGWVDRRLRQTTSKKVDPFGGKSIILIGDPAQLPPVSDKPLYHPNQTADIAHQGHLVYLLFHKVVKLQHNHRVSGDSDNQVLFRQLLHRLRTGHPTENDWKILLTRQPVAVSNIDNFQDCTRLYFSNKDVARFNFIKLGELNEPIAPIKAVHSTQHAKRPNADELSGLQPLMFLARKANVMLTCNLWPAVGLVNGACGKVIDLVYKLGQSPADLPGTVIVQFGHYVGPSISDSFPSCVPICPITATFQECDYIHEHQQLPLRLSWALTIHKAQGLTLPKTWIDLGKTERVLGLSYVAISRVRNHESLVIESMSLQRLQSIKHNKGLYYRVKEEERLAHLALSTT